MNNETTKTLESFNDFLDKAVDNPDLYPSSASFVPLEAVQEKNLLTPGRVNIIIEMKNNEIGSMTELSENLDRSISSVSQDCKKLSTYGLVDIEKDGNKKVPNLKNDHVIILF